MTDWNKGKESISYVTKVWFMEKNKYYKNVVLLYLIDENLIKLYKNNIEIVEI